MRLIFDRTEAFCEQRRVGLVKFLEQLLLLDARIVKMPVVRQFLDLPSTIGGGEIYDDGNYGDDDSDEEDDDDEDGEWH
jgi:hypothetical protein